MHDHEGIKDDNFIRENRKRVWTEAKRAMRRNVKLRLKDGRYEDLREKPKVDKLAWYDDGS